MHTDVVNMMHSPACYPRDRVLVDTYISVRILILQLWVRYYLHYFMRLYCIDFCCVIPIMNIIGYILHVCNFLFLHTLCVCNFLFLHACNFLFFMSFLYFLFFIYFLHTCRDIYAHRKYMYYKYIFVNI